MISRKMHFNFFPGNDIAKTGRGNQNFLEMTFLLQKLLLLRGLIMSNTRKLIIVSYQDLSEGFIGY